VALEREKFVNEYRDALKKVGHFLASIQSQPSLQSPIFYTPNYTVPPESSQEDENQEADETSPQDWKPSISNLPSHSLVIDPPVSPKIASAAIRPRTLPFSSGLGIVSLLGEEKGAAMTSTMTYPLSTSMEIGSSSELRGRDLVEPRAWKESPALQNQVYRVQGLPIDCSSDVEHILRALLNLEASITMEIRSLCISHDPGRLVATVSLGSIPQCLSSSSMSPKDEWRLRYDTSSHISRHDTVEGEKSRRCDITFDTHFRGLTILWSPKNSADHKLE
jgi:hypothetical protein